MKDRRFDDIPEQLRESWEPTDAGGAWLELLGPHVPEDVKRWTPNTDSGFLLSDPHALLAADNSFAAAIEWAKAERVRTPALQVLTSTFFLAEIPHEGDCFMYFCKRASETADVVVWSHETGEIYGPVAYDLPTIARVLDVADSDDDVEARRKRLTPALGRWARDRFPMSLLEDALERDGLWSRADAWPGIEPPSSPAEGIANRAWWVAGALINAAPDTDHIAAQLDYVPDGAFAEDDFQDLPYSALYWLWRAYFLGEDEWHQTALARCKDSQARIVRDAAAYLEAHGGAGDLAEWRARAIEYAAHVRNPFPDRVQVGPLAFERDDSFANLQPVAVEVPAFPCAPGQPLEPWWPEQARLAVPHPDGTRWLVEGHRAHPRKGKHASIPNHIEGLFEVDPITGEGTLFCDTQGEGGYTKWAEYLDEDRVLVINNGRLRLYERTPAGTGRGYLVDQIQLGQERALVMRGLGVVMAYGGVPRWTDGAWVTKAERLSGVRIVDGRLRPTAVVDLALAHLEDHHGVLVGRSEDQTAGYRFEGLTATPPVDAIAFAPSAFAAPDKVWRAGPNAVLDALGPMDVSVESAAGLCLINKAVTDPPGARRAYVGSAEGIRPTEPALAVVSYALMSPTVGCVGTKSEAYRVDLETGEARKLFDMPEGSSLHALRDGFIVLSGDELVARDTGGKEIARVNVGDGAALLVPIHDATVTAMKTATSPLVLLTLDEGGVRLLGAVRPDGDLAGVSYEPVAQPQWCHRLVGKAADGGQLGLRGIAAALADPDYGARLQGSWPDAPWNTAPEIGRM